jgi:hypothetical protein
VPVGVGAIVPDGVVVTVPAGTGDWAGVGAVGGGLDGGFCVATPTAEIVNARANALEMVVMLPVMDWLLWKINWRESMHCECQLA